MQFLILNGSNRARVKERLIKRAIARSAPAYALPGDESEDMLRKRLTVVLPTCKRALLVGKID
jgi:hypothetical protein